MNKPLNTTELKAPHPLARASSSSSRKAAATGMRAASPARSRHAARPSSSRRSRTAPSIPRSQAASTSRASTARLPDGAFVRSVSTGTLEQITFRLGILHALRESGVRVWNDARAIERCVDKSTATFLFQKAGLPTPPTRVLEGLAGAVAHARSRGAPSCREAALRQPGQRHQPRAHRRRAAAARGRRRRLLHAALPARSGRDRLRGLARLRLERPPPRRHDAPRQNLDHQRPPGRRAGAP